MRVNNWGLLVPKRTVRKKRGDKISRREKQSVQKTRDKTSEREERKLKKQWGPSSLGPKRDKK